ncbi:MAG: DNA polymerase III subunit delta, partial [Paludibacteraceae bacterium]|nr:DNA polymerase III subunit delta [Paludibacteraceae bacterium]
MQFRDIIGQDEVKALIIKSIKKGRIPHAQLYWGGEGVGKLALALATVQYINCEHPTDTDSCGECESCRLIAKLSHPDVHFVFPIVKDGSKSAYCDDFMPQWREMMLRSPYFNMHEWMQEINDSGKIGTIYTTESEAIARKLSLKSLKAQFKAVIIW